MQYIFHFFSTSNKAGVLELGKQIVEQLKLVLFDAHFRQESKYLTENNIVPKSTLATDGCSAYDPVLDAKVLIMSLTLCFQEDSPMHAKVTNTPLPSVSLNPCCMCQLKSESVNEKKGIKYVQCFLEIDSHNNEVSKNMGVL
jgi:hypothetical protein